MERGPGLSGRRAAFMLLGLSTLLLHCARAEILLADDFAYPDGALTTVSGGAWSTHSGTAGEAAVVSHQLHLSGANSEDVNASLAGQPYMATGPIHHFYASFVVRFTSLPGSAGTYFAHFKGASATAFAGRVWALTSGAAPGILRIGLSSASGSAPGAVHSEDLRPGTDYLVVTRLVISNSVARLWINPQAESDPWLSTGEPAAGFNLASYAFRQAAGIGTLSIRDLRVGTRFVDVVPGAPSETMPSFLEQPRHQSVAEGGCARFRVAVQAVPEPAFQWRFNDVPLPGGTNAELALTNIRFEQAGFYSVTASNAIDCVTSARAALEVLRPAAPAFTLLSYNLHGNGVLNWSTNSFQVRAIGRQVQFLDPDILTFQEIPVTNNGTAEMEQFVKAFRPGFHLATNSSDDEKIRSVILSRFPIVASRSWLHGIDLAPFGHPDTFTRDLFEAEIRVPGLAQPLHVFTVHLKSGQDTASASKRSAEAGAVSNHFATAFLPASGCRPYVLTGDFNEDLLRPPPSEPRSVQKLANAATGLRLLTPFHPVNRSELTFNIQSDGGLSRRYDYVLPGGLLVSNITAAELFRSDLLDPVPPGLFVNDTRNASDHLPVLVAFANPFDRPIRMHLGWKHGILRACWETVPGAAYELEVSADLVTWVSAGMHHAEDSTMCQAVTPSAGPKFFRVRFVEP